MCTYTPAGREDPRHASTVRRLSDSQHTTLSTQEEKTRLARLTSWPVGVHLVGLDRWRLLLVLVVIAALAESGICVVVGVVLAGELGMC